MKINVNIKLFIIIIISGLFNNQINGSEKIINEKSHIEEGKITNQTQQNIDLTLNFDGGNPLSKPLGKNQTVDVLSNFNKITSLQINNNTIIKGCHKILSDGGMSPEKYDFLTGVLYRVSPEDEITLIYDKNKKSIEAKCKVKEDAVPLFEQGKIINQTKEEIEIQVNFKNSEPLSKTITRDSVLRIANNWTKIIGIKIIKPIEQEINACHKAINSGMSKEKYKFEDSVFTESLDDQIVLVKDEATNIFEAMCNIQEGAQPIK